MATGDKKQVVMAADRAVANGVATLGADALLAAAQRPKAGGLYRDDGTTTLEKSLTEISTTLQNNDPRKWGLGADSILIDSLDNALETGWYKSNVGTPGTGYWNCHAMRYNSASVTQMAIQYDNSGALIAFRMLSGTTFSPWEHLNPPMILGVEYRTTERYLGKPVYAKLVDVGVLPNNTVKSVAHGISNMSDCINIFGHDTANHRPIPSLNFNGNLGVTIGITTTETNIVITTNFDASATSGRVALMYTKATD